MQAALYVRQGRSDLIQASSKVAAHLSPAHHVLRVHAVGCTMAGMGVEQFGKGCLWVLQSLAGWCLSYCREQDSKAMALASVITTAHTSTRLDLDAGPAQGIQHQVCRQAPSSQIALGLHLTGLPTCFISQSARREGALSFT